MIKSLKAFVAFHQKLVDRPWLYSTPDWRIAIGAGLLILLAALINFDMRDRQWAAWQEAPGLTFVDDTPLVSTTDAAYFLAQAEDLMNEEPSRAFAEARLYPENTEQYILENVPEAEIDPPHEISFFDVPMLSAIISWSASQFFDGNVSMAGNAMIAFTAFLTVIAIGGMFWMAGYPIEGALAGLGLGLSSVYVGRTSVGRIDTDQMIVAFLALSLMLVLMTAREKKLPYMIGFALLAALSVKMGLWWHSSTNYLVLIPFLIFLSTFMIQQNWKRALLVAGIFILAFNPFEYVITIFGFVFKVLDVTLRIEASPAETSALNLVFPDTFRTITEQARIDLTATLRSMTGHAAVGYMGLIGFIIWSVVRPSRAVVFFPFVILGLLSVLVGRRYALFAAPFIWFGVGWLVMTAGRYIVSHPSLQEKLPQTGRDFVTLGLGVLMLLTASMMLNTTFVPRPTFSKEVTKTFRDLGQLAGPDSGIIATWWDYGYYAHFHSGGMATIHDGGTQNTPRTHLFARGLVSQNPGELIQITKFLTTRGQAGIEQNGSSLDDLNQAMAQAGNPDKPLYLVLTNQMMGWAGSIATLGRFDPVNGQYLPQDVMQRQYTVIDLKCKQAGDNKLNCNHGLLDITHGTLNGNPIIEKIVLTENGFAKGSDNRNSNSPYILLISKLGSGTKLQLVHRVLWNSSMVQLFERGLYNKDRLELVLDQYPTARIYRIIR